MSKIKNYVDALYGDDIDAIEEELTDIGGGK